MPFHLARKINGDFCFRCLSDSQTVNYEDENPKTTFMERSLHERRKSLQDYG